MTQATSGYLSGGYPDPSPVPTLTQLMVAFNELYRLPVLDKPGIPFEFLQDGMAVSDRIENFQITLLDEVSEGDEISELVRPLNAETLSPEEAQLDVLVQLADWLGDICVYCMSEAAKFGIPLEDVIRVIMESNMSKLQLDGTAKYDDRGKVQKGPNYWAPEPRIRVLLAERIRERREWEQRNQLVFPAIESESGNNEPSN